MINGKPHRRIKSSRGIRQGDPISPFIFVLAMNYLSRLLNHLEKRKAIKGVSINENCNFNHLLFAYDILIFVKDEDTSLMNLQMALKLFELASSLKINATKSTISPVNVTEDKVKIIADQWDTSQQDLSISYLGTPLGGNPLTKSFWETTIDKVDKKLHGWRYNQISKGGKLTLINSSLSSTPNYLFSLFKAPICVYKQIENSWRNFRWNGTNTTRTRPLIN
ncbi:LINE-1 retrotransposable element ORF2 protein [Cucumis melo var. makuwa]|uniref:LINE-1 retrotransposable element ORF2 protein n=1 Tax=Cucumis melo var. makuwa TaxID=1194695 RepID=A0A5A7UB16_CUCMM|nr:LINE-1 retrotransposable element ORF2 protein [Cucumis melo var. makuwa]TYK20442.1 LINE-1 retrotransposable element ORF2 protein [Cucumis melo var. makuwa]